MVKRTAVAAMMLTACLLLPGTAFAWGNTGHRITGEIAQEALSENARQAVRDIAGARTPAMLGTWPDFIRSEREWGFVSTWHYVNVEDGSTVEEVLADSTRTPTPDNVLEGVLYFRAILAGDEETRRHFEELMSANGVEPREGSVELTALTFLIHFVGDLHQPLHVGRADDRGGNSITVNFFDEVKRLHAVWDSGIIESQNLSYTEFAAFLDAELAGTVQAGDGGIEEWARESFEYRQELYKVWSRTSRDNYLPDLGFRYVYDHIGTVKRRLYQAGLRLAGILNEVYE